MSLPCLYWRYSFSYAYCIAKLCLDFVESRRGGDIYFLHTMTEKNGNHLILLVEDNEDDVFLTERALAAAGVKIPLTVVRDGDEAVNYLQGVGEYADRETHPYPSLVLLDLKLPYRSGLEILEWKREQSELPPVPVIVLTSSNQPRDLRSAYALGASSYLVKPPTPQMLCDTARACKLDWLTCG